MNPTLDNTSSGYNGSSGNSLSWNHTIGNLGSAGLILVALESEWFNNPSNPYTSVTFNGVAMTRVGSAASYGGSHVGFVELWALWGNSIPVGGTYTISATGQTPNSNSRMGTCASFRNLKAQNAEATHTSAGSGTNPLTNSLTTLTNNALLVTAYGSQNTPNATSTTGDTRAVITDGGSGEQSECALFYRLAGLAGSKSVSLSVNNPEGEAMITASFVPAQGGGASLINIL